GCSSGTTNVKRVVHEYKVGPRPAVLTLETLDIGGALDNTVVWAYLDCKKTNAELACDDNGGPGNYSKVTTPIVRPNTTVFIVVAGSTANKVGPYQLRITETPTVNVASSGTCASPRLVG